MLSWLQLPLLLMATSYLELVQTRHTNVILIGATGDLAKKYLWQGLFNLFEEETVFQDTFSFYGAARAPPEKGVPLLKEILESRIKCDSVACSKAKEEFISVTAFHQLKTEEQYEALCDTINYKHDCSGGNGDLTEDELQQREYGRLFYLSVPPSAYARTASYINAYCRPQTTATWFRIVLEKPFGQDTATAQELSDQLAANFQEEEIFRIDHYLGKSIAKQILPFRFENERHYGPLWNRHYIDKIEIAMREKVDSKGRISYYEQNGVIRDVIQNHLTELLVLVTMETPKDINNITEITQKKLQLLQEIEPVSKVLLGQYDSYLDEATEELNNTNYISKTPTFAAASINIKNSRWAGVPITLVSGKKLQQRASYVRVTFRRSGHCFEASDMWTDSCAPLKQVIFNIGGGTIQIAAIVVSQSLPYPTGVADWANSQEVQYSEQPGNSFYAFSVKSDMDAYSSLILDVYKNKKQHFIGTDHLIASWNIWSPVLENLQIFPIQKYGDDVDILNFVHTPHKLEYIKENYRWFEGTIADTESKAFDRMEIMPATYLGGRLLVRPIYKLIQRLAREIHTVAVESIEVRRVFHLALSGGNSPTLLLEYIRDNIVQFPWQHTHIWQVDERCVPITNSTQSNFYNLHRILLQNIHIPYFNIHPMPVELMNGLCNMSDGGDQLYEQTMKNYISEGRLDFILLGVGPDGHTASLFPRQPSLQHDVGLVTIATGGPVGTSSDRMSMTFRAINNAQNIAVLATGKTKYNILMTLRESTDPDTYPVLNVKPTAGKLVWYIDETAYFDL